MGIRKDLLPHAAAKLVILRGHPPECIRLVPGSSACNIAALFAVRITVHKCVGLYGLART